MTTDNSFIRIFYSVFFYIQYPFTFKPTFVDTIYALLPVTHSSLELPWYKQTDVVFAIVYVSAM